MVNATKHNASEETKSHETAGLTFLGLFRPIWGVARLRAVTINMTAFLLCLSRNEVSCTPCRDTDRRSSRRGSSGDGEDPYESDDKIDSTKVFLQTQHEQHDNLPIRPFPEVGEASEMLHGATTYLVNSRLVAPSPARHKQKAIAQATNTQGCCSSINPPKGQNPKPSEQKRPMDRYNHTRASVDRERNNRAHERG